MVVFVCFDTMAVWSSIRWYLFFSLFSYELIYLFIIYIFLVNDETIYLYYFRIGLFPKWHIRHNCERITIVSSGIFQLSSLYYLFFSVVSFHHFRFDPPHVFHKRNAFIFIFLLALLSLLNSRSDSFSEQNT